MPVSTHFHSIQSEIRYKLASATGSIRVAVAWFTDELLFKTLLERIAAGVSVIVVMRNDVVNLNSGALNWQQLLDAGGTLYFTPAQPALHHKFCVIDDKMVLTGSYNWTYGAQRNRENLLVIEESEVIRSFHEAFRQLLAEAQEVESIQQAAAKMPPLTEPDLQYQVEAEIRFRQEDATRENQEQQYEELVFTGNATYLRKQYPQAEELLRQALMVNPHGAEAYHLLAGVYWHTRQFKESIEASQQAQAYSLQNVQHWNTLGLAYEGMGRYSESISCFDKGIELEKSESALYRNKFIAQNKAKQLKAADKTALYCG